MKIARRKQSVRCDDHEFASNCSKYAFANAKGQRYTKYYLFDSFIILFFSSGRLMPGLGDA